VLDDLDGEAVEGDLVRIGGPAQEIGEARVAAERGRMHVDAEPRFGRERARGGEGGGDAGAVDERLLALQPDVVEEDVRRLEVGALRPARETLESRDRPAAVVHGTD